MSATNPALPLGSRRSALSTLSRLLDPAATTGIDRGDRRVHQRTGIALHPETCLVGFDPMPELAS